MPSAVPFGRHTLIVEPSRAERSVLAALLREAGADCVEASEMAEGLKRAGQERFDLICTADKLPDGCGEAFCRALRSLPGTSAIPVLVLARDADPSRFGVLLAAGATEIFHRQDVERLRRFLVTILPPHPTLSGRVLVVEHNPAEAEAVVTVLRSLGLAVDHVAQPMHALARLSEQPVDLLLTGLMLDASMSGGSLIRELRALPGEIGRTPVLAMAPPADSALRVDVLRSGADDFLPKPVVAEELVVRVEKLLRAKRRIEESEAKRARLETLAVIDPLTTLNNRRFLDVVAPMYLAEGRRHGFPVSVILLDVDHFGRINHTYGEPTGEDVLRSIGRLLRRECRRGDVAVRCGDEEFMLLLSHCEIADARRKAEALRLRIAGLNPAGIGITASLGVTQALGIPDEEFNEVFDRAGQALISAHKGGHDRVVVASR